MWLPERFYGSSLYVILDREISLIFNGKEVFTTIMLDLLKIFDCISRELQLANLKVPMALRKYQSKLFRHSLNL